MIKKVINSLFPYRCIFCQRLCEKHYAVCEACFATLPWNIQGCRICARPLEVRSANQLCADCIQHKPCFHRIISPLIYSHPFATLITRLKFNHQLLNADILAKLFLDAFEKQNALPDIIIPMPLHKKRCRRRGFNQALEIAKPIAKQLQIPIDKKSVCRVKNTKAQSELNAQQRASNVRNAFGIQKNINAQHVVIFDDVVTTGSTINALTQCLLKHGVERIDVWCCARVK